MDSARAEAAAAFRRARETREEQKEMNYRALGNTGLLVGEIGMGCEGLTGGEEHIREMFAAARTMGVNYLDFYTADPEVRSSVGRALKEVPGHFVLQGHLCSVWQNGQYKRTREIQEVKEGFADLMERLDVPSLDVGMIHYVDSMVDWRAVLDGPVGAFARELKQSGRIHHIGLSSHNPQVALAAAESGLIEVLMFSINPCYDLQPAGEDCEALWSEANYEKQLTNMNPDRQALYETCNRLGVGITVMKAFGGGDLLDEKLSPAGKALTAYQCLHYCLTRPGVATVLAGARTPAELVKSAGYSDASEVEKDFAPAFARFPKIRWEGHCMYCGHCAPCPKGIDVAMVTKFLNLCKAQGHMPETVREHYRVLEHKASECIACGACETRCPFRVPVRENMRRAAELFGGVE